MEIAQFLELLDHKWDRHGDADRANGEKFNHPLHLDWSAGPHPLAERQPNHLRTEEERMLWSSFAGIDFELLDLLPQQLRNRLAPHFIGDVKREHIDRLSLVTHIDEINIIEKA